MSAASKSQAPVGTEPHGYEPSKVLRYLNNPMGSGIWRTELQFRRPPVEATDEKGGRIQIIHSTGMEFLHWIVVSGLEWPQGEEDEARPLKSRAESLTRPRTTVRTWNATTGTWHTRAQFHTIVRRRGTTVEIVDNGPADPQPSQATVDKFRELFPDIELTETEDSIGLSSEFPPQYLIVLPDARNSLVAYSISKETCERLSEVAATFVTPLGASVTHRTEKLYTPEEVTFLPYFGLLKIYADANSITTNPGARRDLRSAIEKISISSPDESIRESGSALEQLLSEIYEQCFREKAPSRPLGVELRELGSRATEIVGDTVVRGSDFDPREIHEELGPHIESSKDPAVRAGLIASQKLATHAGDAKERLGKLEKAIEAGRSRSHPLFSDEIARSLERAIDLRNAATHRGSRRITRFEAAVAARGVVNLATWWSKKDQMVEDWDAPLQTVVSRILKTGPTTSLD